ncbi:hypothetical protein BWQ96_10471 [Gracilariopsis chorda]|uniref:Uncharacterized protein n=1 Tax=Gracilariopsis chorda TaxID=448386 RepID=A0A2V3ICK0_9FLOR|nr:hypothetical protein BWQ96_10471 [Gracilariopsis chorda]|eukprot:PXF39815.1 hypothetical protein BWQ96_10471 [Gracilariopsis chorda]
MRTRSQAPVLREKSQNTVHNMVGGRVREREKSNTVTEHNISPGADRRDDSISPAKMQDTASQDAVVEGDTEGEHCQDAAMEGDPEGEYCYNAAVEGDAEGEQCNAKGEHCQDVGAGGDIQGELCRESGVAIIDPPTAYRDDNSAVEECDQGPDPEPAGPEDRCGERGVGSDIQGDSCQQTGVAVVKIDQNRSVRG